MSNDYQTGDVDAESASGGIGVTDIYYVLFRRKWLILIGCVLGFLVAGMVWKKKQPLYQSNAKLLVKWVSDVRSPTPVGTDPSTISPDSQGAYIINSEMEILKSMDVIRAAAKLTGPENILPKGADANDLERAAGLIYKNLRVSNPQKTSILELQFQHHDAATTERVLREMIDFYFRKHDEVHRATGISISNVLAEKKLKSEQLARTEKDLSELKAGVHVSSLEDAKKARAEQESKIIQELDKARSDLAQRRAELEELGKLQPAGLAPTPQATNIPQSRIDEYRAILTDIDRLTRNRQQLLLTFSDSDANPQVLANRQQLNKAQLLRKQMETETPGLLRVMTPLPAAVAGTVSAPQGNEFATQGGLVKALEAKVEELTNQVARVRGEVQAIDAAEAGIKALQRKRDSEEAEVANLEKILRQAQFDAELGSGRNANISRVQEPSAAYRDFSDLYKKLAMSVMGGVVVAVVLAFILELLLDRSLKTPKQVETLLKVPLFLSIPVLKLRGLISAGTPVQPSGSGGSKKKGGTPSEQAEVALEVAAPSPQPEQGMKPYHDALRDRLMNYFEVRDMVHKPKLVAVTSCSNGAGVSSIATGLAASLSETGDGNVLLVDMRGQKGAAHAFYNGKPACGLAEALENDTRNSAQVDEHLYVVSAGSAQSKLHKIVPQHFSQLIPKLKASDYDYIIFDMPPVAQTSITAKVSRFMDMVLMVVESEKTDKDMAQRAGNLLAESNATVATVINKRKRYVPEWLQQEFY